MGELAAPRYTVFPLKLSAVGLALVLCGPPAAFAQAGGSRPAGSPASSMPVPRNPVRIGTPNAWPGPRVPGISEQADGARARGGPRLPEHVPPAITRLDADEAPVPANDVVVIPVTTILIALLVVVVILAVD